MILEKFFYLYIYNIDERNYGNNLNKTKGERPFVLFFFRIERSSKITRSRNS